MGEYTDKKRKGNIGEALVELILSSFCLVHKIDGSKDIGYDFICELTKRESPSNILFYVQVKNWVRQPGDNDLQKQREYWEGSPIPVFLFWINAKDKEKIPFEIINNLTSELKISQLKYKRYTPITHGNKEPQIQSFRPFSKSDFLRDIMVDYTRCLYKRGLATVIKKEDFAESGDVIKKLGNNCLFIDDVIPREYAGEFIGNSWTNLIATAKSLFKAGQNNRDYLKLALEHAVLAKKMLAYANPEYSGFNQKIDKIISDIQTIYK